MNTFECIINRNLNVLLETYQGHLVYFNDVKTVLYNADIQFLDVKGDSES